MLPTITTRDWHRKKKEPGEKDEGENDAEVP
jgi:hypothetical protein